MTPIWMKMMAGAMPASLNWEKAAALLQRLTLKYRFLPSIAEIYAEWKAMEMEEKQGKYLVVPSPGPKRGHMPHYVKTRLAGIMSGNRPVLPPASKELITFARQHFPDISDEVIEKNRLEISACQREQAREEAGHKPYRTVMRLNGKGEVELLMRV